MKKIIIEVENDIDIQKGIEIKLIRDIFKGVFNYNVKKISYSEEYDIEQVKK